MWPFLYRLSSPKYFFNLSTKILPFLKGSVLCFFLVGMVWSLYIAPKDYQQGDAFRIIYFHVPAAFMSLGIYAYMSFCAILFLVWRIKLAALILKESCYLGAMMSLLALITGSLWGKPMWGTWWIWDARLTSELILLFIYLGLIGVVGALQDRQRAMSALSILTLVGALDIPIIHYSVNWWNTLHQGATLAAFKKPSMAPSMLYPLLWMIVTYFLYYLTVLLMRVQVSLLWRERRSSWVRQWLEGRS